MRLSVDSLTCGWCWCWPDGRPGHTDSGRPDLLLTGRHSQTCWCPPTPPGSQQHWSEECLLYCLFLIPCFPACLLPLYNVLTTGRERAGRLTSQIYNATESPQSHNSSRIKIISQRLQALVVGLRVAPGAKLPSAALQLQCCLALAASSHPLPSHWLGRQTDVSNVNDIIMEYLYN